MLGELLFKSRLWQNTLADFAKARNTAAPGVELHCIDGASHKIATLVPLKSCLVAAVYTAPGMTNVRFIAYESIKDIELKEEPAETQFKGKGHLRK